jgi:hypothetical protein
MKKQQQYASPEFEVVPYKYNHKYIESEQDMLVVGYVNDIRGRTALFAPAWLIASPRNDILCLPLTVLAQSLQRLGRQS